MISKEYCKCPKCGSECEVDTSMILTSYPPKYQAFCKNCNEVFYIFCSDVYGKASINPENNTLKKDADYHNDIHRIADALEKIAKSLDGEKKQQQLKTIDDVKCPYCGSPDVEYTFGKASISTSTNGPKLHYFCKHCHMEFDADNKIEVKEMTDEEREKLSKEYIKRHLDLATAPSPSITLHNFSCENCWWYQQQKANPNLTMTAGDTPCNWCPKMQITCTSNLSSEIKC